MTQARSKQVSLPSKHRKHLTNRLIDIPRQYASISSTVSAWGNNVNTVFK
jgi:hypothetical protein